MILSLLLSLSLDAKAVPLQLTQQGRLVDSSGAAVTGLHTLTFRIYDTATAGSTLWSESLTVQFNNGYYATVLGTNNDLDSDTLSLYPLYLEIQLDSNAAMSPRQSINSAPYAQIAGVAESLEGGTVDATNISVNGTQVISSSGVWTGQPVTPQWSDIQSMPGGFADETDDMLTGPQVIQYVENESGLNLQASTKIAGNSIVTSATTLQPSWNNVQSIPAGFADNTDDTLSNAQVENIIEGVVGLNLSLGAKVNNSVIVTESSTLAWNKLTGVPAGLADGDDLDLLSANCISGEIVGWNGSAWTCVSDNTLSAAQVGSFISNNVYDLHPNSTIDGLAFLTEVDNTLANLSCINDGEVARYDLSADEWYCDADIDTVLSENTVEGYITNGAIDLAANSKMGGINLLTESSDLDWSKILGVPTGLSDGDDFLSESEVESYITNSSINLAAGSQVGSSGILTSSSNLAWGKLTGVPSGLSDGDDFLSESEVESYITNGSINLAAGSQVGGSAIVTASTDSDTLGDLSCSTDQIAKYDGSAWVCADNTPSGTLSYASMYQITESTGSNPRIAYCNDANDILLYGGCSVGTTISSTHPIDPTSDTQISGWSCDGGSGITAYAVCLALP